MPSCFEKWFEKKRRNTMSLQFSWIQLWWVLKDAVLHTMCHLCRLSRRIISTNRGTNKKYSRSKRKYIFKKYNVFHCPFLSCVINAVRSRVCLFVSITNDRQELFYTSITFLHGQITPGTENTYDQHRHCVHFLMFSFHAHTFVQGFPLHCCIGYSCIGYRRRRRRCSCFFMHYCHCYCFFIRRLSCDASSWIT